MGLQITHFTQLLPKLIKNPKMLFQDEKALEKGIPLLSFFAPFGELMFGPIILYIQQTIDSTKPEDRKKAVIQEVSSQGVTVLAHASSFIVGGLAARRVLPKLNPALFVKDSNALHNGETLACISGAFMGTTFLRPLLTSKILNKTDKKASDDSSSGAGGSSAPAPPKLNYGLASYNLNYRSNALTI